MNGSGRGPSRITGRPYRMSWSGQLALPDVRSGRETLPEVLEWSVIPPGCPEVVGRPSRMSGSDREALPDVREWSGGPTGCSGVV